jgi:hypothetical protein
MLSFLNHCCSLLLSLAFAPCLFGCSIAATLMCTGALATLQPAHSSIAAGQGEVRGGFFLSNPFATLTLSRCVRPSRYSHTPDMSHSACCLAVPIKVAKLTAPSSTSYMPLFARAPLCASPLPYGLPSLASTPPVAWSHSLALPFLGSCNRFVLSLPLLLYLPAAAL